MKQLDLIVTDPAGLHARQATLFVKAAKRFESDIRVEHGTKEANAKSMTSLLKLGAESNAQIRIIVNGPDEEAALNALKSLMEMDRMEDEKPPGQDQPQTGQDQSKPAQYSGSVLHGMPAAPGIAIGPLFHFRRDQSIVPETAAKPSQEKERLENTIGAARTQLDTLHSRAKERIGDATAEIFIAQQTILDDPALIDAANAKINDGFSAAKAWQIAIETNAAQLAKLKDELLAAREADVRDVGNRVLNLLLDSGLQKLVLPDHAVILAAGDLLPSDTVNLDIKQVLGVCTATGGPTSHSAIIARELGIPALVGIGPEVQEIAPGTQVILDGEAGTLTVNPDPETLAAAKVLLRKRRRRHAAEKEAAVKPAITRDGHAIQVVANVSRVRDAKQAGMCGADGIGLVRTEFLFLDRSDPPTEAEQMEAYRDIALALPDLPVTIRSLDVGGDKPLPYLQLPREENPFLGQRGIRLTLIQRDLLLTQIRAVLGAAAAGCVVRIMFPMIATLQEWRTVRTLAAEARADLNAPKVELGIMIEVPAAALLAEAFAKEADFFSIGTNDLTQYTLAMDRTHPALAEQADGLHPAVLGLIDRTVRAAHTEGKRVGICGELAADLPAIPILAGLGVDGLSVNIPSIPEVKARIRSLTFSKAQQLARQALECSTAPEVRKLVAVI